MPPGRDGYAGTPSARRARRRCCGGRCRWPASSRPTGRAGRGRDLTAGLTVAALAVPSAMAYAQLAGLTADRRPVRPAAPDRGVRPLRLVAAPDRRPGGLARGARRRGRAGDGRGGQRRSRRARGDARAADRRRASRRLARAPGLVADYLSRPVLIGYIHGVAVVLVIGQLGKLLGLDVDAAGPDPAARRGAPRARRRQRGRPSRSARSRSPSCAAALRRAARAGRARWSSSGDRRLLAARPRRPRRRRRRRDPVRAPGDRRPLVPSLGTRSSSSPRRSGSSSSASPTRSSPPARSPAVTATTSRVRQELLAMGAANAAAGSTRDADRRQRLAHGGQRRDGRAQPVRRAARRRARRARPAVPHRPDRRPAQGGARRGDRLRGDRARRAGRLARALGDRPRGARDRSGHGRRCGRRRRARGDRVRRRPVDRRRRPAQRRPHDAVLGWVEPLGR